MTRERNLMLRAIAGELSERERMQFDRACAANPALSDEFNRLRRLHDLTAETPPPRFAPGFSDRVMKRIASAVAQRPTVLADLLAPVFARLAPAAFVVAVVIAGVNAALWKSADQTVVEAALGLHPVTIDDAYRGMLATPSVDAPAEEQ